MNENLMTSEGRELRISQLFAAAEEIIVDAELLKVLAAYTAGMAIKDFDTCVNLAIAVYKTGRPKTSVVLTNIKSPHEVDGGTLYMVEARIEGTDIYRVGKTADEAIGRLTGDFNTEFNINYRWGFAPSTPYEQ